jgi:TusA-related sulfurtransferase
MSGEYGNLYMTNLAGVKLSDINVILKMCQEREITLVVFDSLTRIHSLKENDADDVKKIFEAMLALLKSNISIIMTHHHRKTPMFGAKNGSEEMRGSIDILAQIDCHLAIDQVAIDKSYLVLRQLKIRIAENIPDFKVGIERGTDDLLSFIYGGSFSKMDERNILAAMNRDAILKIIMDNPGFTKEEIKEKTKGQVAQMAIQAILTDLEKENVIFTRTQKPKTYYIKEEISTLF